MLERAPEPSPFSDLILDRSRLQSRLEEEVARVRRAGGFLSLALIGWHEEREHAVADAALMRFRACLRTEDVVGRLALQRIAVVMPDTDRRQARRAARRLVALATHQVDGERGRASVGVCTSYGEIEGGTDALLDAASIALRECPPGEAKESAALRSLPRLLVVDDDAELALALADTATDLGWEGCACSDPVEAIERIHHSGCEAVLLDLVIPATSGVALLRESRRLFPRRPAALLSDTRTPPELIAEAASLGPVILLGKPLTRRDLEATLKLFRSLLPGVVRR